MIKYSQIDEYVGSLTGADPGFWFGKGTLQVSQRGPRAESRGGLAAIPQKPEES